jgi:hypothetical protein
MNIQTMKENPKESLPVSSRWRGLEAIDETLVHFDRLLRETGGPIGPGGTLHPGQTLILSWEMFSLFVILT